jgi:hypothetical protein
VTDSVHGCSRRPGPDHPRPSSSAALLIAIALATGGDRAAAQQAPPSGGVPRSAQVGVISEPITVDGVLDEGVWGSAPTIGDLVQRQPQPGSMPTERTEVRLLRDQDNLYIGVIAFDSEPDRILGTQMARDAGLGSDDRVEILLDTFRDQRSAFYFATNPSGALVDGLTFGNGQLNTDWDTTWDVQTTRSDLGWVAEFAIPFKSLSFPTGGGVWGFNVARNIYRKLEDVRWTGARLETQFLQVSEAGEIRSFEGLSQGLGLELRPFIGGRAFHYAASGDDTVRVKPGLDLSYRITPSLKLIGTVNTDFGETEVDARQINLSRFSLLFPEKRAFFLEDAGVFSFTSTGPGTPGGIPGTGADVFPFFSRRIGLLASQEVPIDVGGKLTGRLGRTELGLLSVRTREVEGLVEAANLVVGRVKWDLLEQSYVGLVFTGGDPASARSSQTYGADVRLATSSLFGASRNLDVTGYAARSVREGVSGREWSYGFSARYPNDRIDGQIVLRDIQENFDPALGFVQRGNVRLFRVGASFNPRPRDFLGIQQMFHDAFYTRFTRLEDGALESWDLYVTPIDWHLKSGDNVHSVLDFNPTFERLFEPFEISPGVVLPVGGYRFTRFRSSVATATRRPLSANLGFGWGSYWSGDAEQLTAALTYRLPPWFSVTVNTNQTFARLPEGDFTARIFTLGAGYSASPALSLSNLVQYDNRSRNLGWQSRVRWTLRPGSDFFASFQQGWLRDEVGDDARFRAQDRKASLKLQYSVRF